MKKVLLAVSMLATLVAMPAFAAVQNIKVGGDIDSTFIYRDRFDLGRDRSGTNGNDASEYKQNLFITQTRLRVDADLSDNVSATVALINERPWDNEGDVNTQSTSDTNIQLNLAYVKLREMLYSPLTVQVGRQQFNYGNAFIVGANGPNNLANAGGLNKVAQDLTKRTALDGIKLVFDYHPLTIDVFGAKVDANGLTGTGPRKDEVDLYGINANYQLGDQWNTTLETYFFSKFDRSLQTVAGAKTDTVFVPGLRASTNPIKGLNVQGEVAWQGGNKATTSTSGAARADNLQRQALGAEAIVNYQVQYEKVAKWKPAVTGVYTYVSGERNPSDGRDPFRPNSKNTWTGWDPMFEDQGGGTIYNTLFDLTNAHIVTTSAQISPIEDVTAKVTWTGLWLAREPDLGGVGNNQGTTVGNKYNFNMRQPDGTTITPAITSNRAIGWEIDGDLNYDYTEDVKLGLSLGWFVPGDFFGSTNQQTAKQALAHVGVTF